MQRFIGAILGIILINFILPLFGVKVAVAVGSTIGCAFLILILFFTFDKMKIHRLRRSFCYDALKYAEKRRAAFDKPPYGSYELQQIKKAQKQGDLASVHALIASSDTALREREQAQRKL